MTFRKVLFWAHLVAGVVAGTVILVMCVTGTLLTFQQSVLRFVERDQRFVSPPAPGAPRLDVDALLAQVRLAVPDAAPTTVTLDSDPRAAAAVAVGTQGTLFVDPYTGRVLGTGSARARAFYRSVTNWHRWLAVEGEGRATARAITGACNAAFLVLAVTGLYLWMPRQWSWRHVAPVIWFRRGLRGKPRDFNWHNTVGLWCAPILIVLTTTGMVISYPWASNLVYTLTGSPRPAAAAGRGGGAGRGGEIAAGERGGRGGRGGEIAAGERGGRGRGGDGGDGSNRERPAGATARSSRRAAGGSAGSSRVDVRTRRTAGTAVADDDHSSAAAAGWSRRVLDVGPRLLELVCAFDVDARRRDRRDGPLGTIRGQQSRTEGARLDALRSHGRARRPRRRGVRRTGICRRRSPRLDRSRAGVETAGRVARPQPGASHGRAAARSSGQRGVAFAARSTSRQ